MRIKRFRAKDTQTALQMVKEELGQEAVILNTREIQDENDKSPVVEITAGVGYQPDQASSPAVEECDRTGPQNPVGTPSLKVLENGLTEIKELLLDLTHRSSLSERLRDRKELLRLYRELVTAELDSSIARSLVERLGSSDNGRLPSPRKRLKSGLASLLKTNNPFHKTSVGWGPQVLVLVGPSGVGKTTTLAKLAAVNSVRAKKKVALISLDCFRLGAAEQLKTYARIMGLPLSIAQDKAELKQAFDLYEKLDLILIDTSGRFPGRENDLRELAAYIALAPDPQVLLVLSAGTKDRDLALTIRQAEPLGVKSLVISKIDETQNYGNVINNLIRFKKPVSFITNGQKVPEDLIQATPDRLAELITSGGECPIYSF